jgi:hypothetical protein
MGDNRTLVGKAEAGRGAGVAAKVGVEVAVGASVSIGGCAVGDGAGVGVSVSGAGVGVWVSSGVGDTTISTPTGEEGATVSGGGVDWPGDCAIEVEGW